MANFSIPFHFNLGVLVCNRPQYPLEGPTPTGSFDTNCGVPIQGANTIRGALSMLLVASSSAKSQSGEAFVGCEHKEVGTK